MELVGGEAVTPGDHPGYEKESGETSGCHGKDRASREGQDHCDLGAIEAAERTGRDRREGVLNSIWGFGFRL